MAKVISDTDLLTLGKSYSFGLLCISFGNVYQFLCVPFILFGFRVGCGV